MRWLTYALLFSAIGVAAATNAAAQYHGGGVKSGLPAPLPSSTALGAGALTSRPSSTARSTQAARGYVTSNGRVVRSVCRYGYGRNCGAYPFAYWLAPYYYPTDYGTPYGEGPDYNPAEDPSLQAAMAAQNALVQQVQKLSDQVSQLQEGQQARPQPAPIQEEAQPQSQPPSIPLTLILHDGQRLQVQNYAVMDHMFWDFTRQPTRKIPISNIDIAASAKATEAKGGEFPELSKQ
jgi:hypothetical protein